MIMIRGPKTFYFDFDRPKNIGESLKVETEFIIKIKKSSAENNIKNKIQKSFFKYKYGNNIHEHGNK